VTPGGTVRLSLYVAIRRAAVRPRMVVFSEVLEVLSAASTIAVILGIPFIYLQMRQNARLVEAANRQTELVARQNRSQVLLNIAEHMTDRDFIMQRKAVREIIARRTANGWEGFVDSVDGFEVRAFAVQYESAGIMVTLELLEEPALLETLGYLVAIDGNALAPAVAEFEKVWGRMTFPNFRRIAEHSEAYWKGRDVEGLGARAEGPSSSGHPGSTPGLPPSGRT
jgi:hypothetical protein